MKRGGRRCRTGEVQFIMLFTKFVLLQMLSPFGFFFRKMLKVSYHLKPMKEALEKQLFNNGVQSFNCKQASRHYIQTPFVQARSVAVTKYLSSSVYPKMASHHRDAVKICALRRRRANLQSETYVQLEPGQNEEFVSKEELKVRLKGWLEKWSGKSLPPDLARFETIDDAVTYLVKSVCELEIDGLVGSIQWYQVRLE